jgi:hypothetical protein
MLQHRAKFAASFWRVQQDPVSDVALWRNRGPDGGDIRDSYFGRASLASECGYVLRVVGSLLVSVGHDRNATACEWRPVRMVGIAGAPDARGCGKPKFCHGFSTLLAFHDVHSAAGR